jgi:GNAT superfamily N-acetyltransferase
MPKSDTEIEFSIADPAAPPASDLIEAMVAEMRELYGIVGHVGVPLELSELAPPGGAYLVGRARTGGDAGGEVVAGGGVRTIGEGVGEIKRMYVVPEWRGRGAGAQLLAALEAAAVALGLSAVRLDTGPSQPGARHLYEKSGYRQIPNYNGNTAAAFWGEKQLV